MGQLGLRLLGHPEVYHAGQGLKLPTRKALALLVYLVVAGGTPSRESLATLFWPDSNNRQGRAILRNTLTYLRNALNDQIEPHLLIEREALGFDFSSQFSLDLSLLSLAVKAIPAGSTQTEPLQLALRSYRGDFLSGFSVGDAPEFERWASVQREYWHQQLDLICEQLSTRQITQGDFTGAGETLVRWLELNPLNELIYQRRMQLQLAQGDRESARHTYEACLAMLAAEFGAKPAPETVALAQQLSAPRASPRGSSPSPALPRYLEMPLTGRSIEYLKLCELYQRVRQEEVHLVTLEGEAGIGKTRLAAEFLQWAATEGADVIRGRAFEMGGRLPYQPIVEGWRERLEKENAPDDLLADVWLAELSRLLPELKERYPDLPAPTGDEGMARPRLFEAVARLGLALAKRAPLILFIDDLQWADLASLDLLHYAARRWTESSGSILVLMNLRTEALVAGAELITWLEGLKRDCSLTRLSLTPLVLTDIERLIKTIARFESETEAGESMPGPLIVRTHQTDRSSPSPLSLFSHWLFTETGGQPFFITETIKSLLERELLALQPGPEGQWILRISAAMVTQCTTPGMRSIPPGVLDIIRARLAQLTPPALAMLSAGAVLGQNFSFEQLCQVADLGEKEGLLALDELLIRHLFQPVGREEMQDVEPLYLFGHDKIRDVAYTEAGDTRRQVLHRRALAALENSSARPAELAQHALAGRQLEAAFQYNLAAGEAALHLFALHEAITHYEQARWIGAEIQPRLQAQIPVQTWRQLYLQLGRAYELCGQMDQAQTVYQTLLHLAQERGQPEIECLTLNRLATLAVQNQFDLGLSRRLLEEALQVAQKNDDRPGLAETEWNLAQIGVYIWDAQATLTHGQRALVLARTLDLKELIARSLNVLALGSSNLGRWRQKEIYATEAAALYAGLGNRAMEADCLSLIAHARTSSGQTQAGIEVGRQALAIVNEIENPWGQVTASLHLALGLLDGGQYEEALALAAQAVNLARTHRVIPLLPYILVRLGSVQRALQAFEAACATHQAALAANEAITSQPFAEMIHAELCADYVLVEDWALAYAHARQAVALRNYDLLYFGLTRWAETEALLHGGDIELARTDTGRFGWLVEDPGHGANTPRFRIPYLWCQAVLAGWEGETALASGHLEAAALLAEEIGLPGEHWQILGRLVVLYQKQGRPEQAEQARSRALNIGQGLADQIKDEKLRTKFLTNLRRSINHDSSGYPAV